MFKRILYTLKLNMIPSAHKRAQWMREKGVFRMLGENVSLQFRKIPLYPQCIAFHNNIVVASNVSFLTHDAIHLVLNRYLKQQKIPENIGCIEVMDDCFIGANSTIMPNVRIGPKAIVAAGSMVTKDVPPGEIWGGVPAKCIGYFDDLLKKRSELCFQMENIKMPKSQNMVDATAEYYWSRFQQLHERPANNKNIGENKMSNSEKYRSIFVSVFNVDESILDASFNFKDVKVWDSLTHLTLISELEDSFNVVFETEDILHFGDYENGMKILSKYGVDFGF